MVLGAVTGILQGSHLLLELQHIFRLDQTGAKAHISLHQVDELFGSLLGRHKNPSVLEYFQNGRILRFFLEMSRQILRHCESVRAPTSFSAEFISNPESTK